MDVKGHDFFLNDGEEGTENEGFGNPLTLDSAGFFGVFFFNCLIFFPQLGSHFFCLSVNVVSFSEFSDVVRTILLKKSSY